MSTRAVTDGNGTLPVVPAEPTSKKKLNMINVAIVVASLAITGLALIAEIPLAVAAFGGFSLAVIVYAPFYDTPPKVIYKSGGEEKRLTATNRALAEKTVKLDAEHEAIHDVLLKLSEMVTALQTLDSEEESSTAPDQSIQDLDAWGHLASDHREKLTTIAEELKKVKSCISDLTKKAANAAEFEKELTLTNEALERLMPFITKMHLDHAGSVGAHSAIVIDHSPMMRGPVRDRDMPKPPGFKDKANFPINATLQALKEFSEGVYSSPAQALVAASNRDAADPLRIIFTE